MTCNSTFFFRCSHWITAAVVNREEPNCTESTTKTIFLRSFRFDCDIRNTITMKHIWWIWISCVSPLTFFCIYEHELVCFALLRTAFHSIADNLISWTIFCISRYISSSFSLLFLFSPFELGMCHPKAWKKK